MQVSCKWGGGKHVLHPNTSLGLAPWSSVMATHPFGLRLLLHNV